MPDFLVSGKSGRPRKQMPAQPSRGHRVSLPARKRQSRKRGNPKYASQGRKRTANGPAPSYGVDYANLGAVNKQHAAIENNPFTDGEIVLKTVIQGAWHRPIFDFDNKRFAEGKVAPPAIKAQDDQPVFIFTVATDNPVIQFSGD